MDFQQQFPHPSRKNDPFIIEWTKGYSTTRVFYRNRLLGETKSFRELLNGITITDEHAGMVELKLLRDPFALELKVDGLHSPVNRNHPKFNLPQSGVNFILPFLFSLLFSWAFLSGPNPDYRNLRQIDIITGIAFAFCAAIYISAIVLLSYRKTIGFFIGSGMYLIHYLLFIGMTFQPGMRLNTFGWIVLVLLTGQMVSIGFSFKRIGDLLKYRKLRNAEEVLLDDVRS